MIVMITSDFYSEYELYRTEDPEDIKKDITNIDTSKHELIGSHDDIWTDEALKMADEVIYIEDYMED